METRRDSAIVVSLNSLNDPRPLCQHKFWHSLYFNGIDDHSVKPNGRHRALRMPSPGSWIYHVNGFERHCVMNSHLRQTRSLIAECVS
jgi:hypothetical protein